MVCPVSGGGPFALLAAARIAYPVPAALDVGIQQGFPRMREMPAFIGMLPRALSGSKPGQKKRGGRGRRGAAEKSLIS